MNRTFTTSRVLTLLALTVCPVSATEGSSYKSAAAPALSPAADTHRLHRPILRGRDHAAHPANALPSYKERPTPARLCCSFRATSRSRPVARNPPERVPMKTLDNHTIRRLFRNVIVTGRGEVGYSPEYEQFFADGRYTRRTIRGNLLCVVLSQFPGEQCRTVVQSEDNTIFFGDVAGKPERAIEIEAIRS
jgi:hypothetical protein